MGQSWCHCLKERKAESLLGQGTPRAAAGCLCPCRAVGSSVGRQSPCQWPTLCWLLQSSSIFSRYVGVEAHADVWSCRISVSLRSQCCVCSPRAHSPLHTSMHPCIFLWGQVHPFLPRTSRPYLALYSHPPITKGGQCGRFLGFPPPSLAPSVSFSALRGWPRSEPQPPRLPEGMDSRLGISEKDTVC